MRPHKVYQMGLGRSPQVGHVTPLPLGPRKDQLEFQGNGMRREHSMWIYGEQVSKGCWMPSPWKNALERGESIWQRSYGMAQQDAENLHHGEQLAQEAREAISSEGLVTERDWAPGAINRLRLWTQELTSLYLYIVRRPLTGRIQKT